MNLVDHNDHMLSTCGTERQQMAQQTFLAHFQHATTQ